MRYFSVYPLPGTAPLNNLRYEKDFAYASRDPLWKQARENGWQGALTSLNHEHTPLKLGDQEAVDFYVKLIEDTRTTCPGLRLGIYARGPVRSTSAHKSATAMLEWRTLNDFLRPISNACDYIAPSLYTLTRDKNTWIEFADAQAAESRRVANGKPVYGWLWPQYHQALEKQFGIPRKTYLPKDFWRIQLLWASRNLDGVLFWNHKVSDPCWATTDAFIREGQQKRNEQ